MYYLVHRDGHAAKLRNNHPHNSLKSQLISSTYKADQTQNQTQTQNIKVVSTTNCLVHFKDYLFTFLGDFPADLAFVC